MGGGAVVVSARGGGSVVVRLPPTNPSAALPLPGAHCPSPPTPQWCLPIPLCHRLPAFPRARPLPRLTRFLAFYAYPHPSTLPPLAFVLRGRPQILTPAATPAACPGKPLCRSLPLPQPNSSPPLWAARPALHLMYPQSHDDLRRPVAYAATNPHHPLVSPPRPSPGPNCPSSIETRTPALSGYMRPRQVAMTHAAGPSPRCPRLALPLPLSFPHRHPPFRPPLTAPNPSIRLHDMPPPPTGLGPARGPKL